MSIEAPVGRLAPSPTGVLHLGNARSFLLAWLDLRRRGGVVHMRIEDIDGPRVREGAAEQALEDLAWLGLDWDTEPVFQSAFSTRHRAALQLLSDRGEVYPCVCSRKDVERAASAPHAGEEGPIYPGTCRGRWSSVEEATAETGKQACWRYEVPDRTMVVRDRVVGELRCNPAQALGDFVVWKRDGLPAYQLAVVVDDAAAGVNSVARGDDLLLSAVRQELLYSSLGVDIPEWAHLPLVVGMDGLRLAKRHGDTSLRRFRESGVTAETLVGWLASVSGLRPDDSACSPSELVESFDLELLPRAAVVWSGYPLPADGE